MTTPTPVLAIGESLIDVVRRPGEDDAVEHVGGSPLNVAVGLARLGVPAELATWIGTDERGRRITDLLARNDVRLSPGSDGAARTSTATATLAADGQATYDFDLTWDLPVITPQVTPGILHTGSLAGVIEPGASRVRTMIAEGRATAAVTYDPNARPSLMGGPEDALLDVETLVALADVVKVSDEDVAWMVGDDSETALLQRVQRWLGLGTGLVVVTRGGGGASALTRGGVRVDVESERVDVVDTVGAGDSFMAGLIDGLSRTGLLPTPRGSVRASDVVARVRPELLETVLRRCSRIAGITVSRAGANPPTAAELGDLAEI